MSLQPLLPQQQLHAHNSIQSAIENLLAMSILHSTSMMSSTIVVPYNTVKLGITLPKSTIQKIDQGRCDIPRSRYIRRAIERYNDGNSKDIVNNKAGVFFVALLYLESQHIVNINWDKLNDIKYLDH